ncbi:hypothetical protein BG910_05940 [Neisseria chenwenguii]|uniref:Uncharacterized protein n=1 Tax=Neisseria chenwenguii TaxID=1853278 RepID=A0A220S1F8_9NEIS|nr:hypothetical protein [Neisseria chenwenguii]ASK27340.1 hypothetical protein BG910_05940 [Neisseria chenwenguii]
MLSFAVYNMPLADYEALSEQFRSQQITPLQYQAELGRLSVVSGFDATAAEYIVSLKEQGRAVTAASPNAWTTHLGIRAGLLAEMLAERVAHTEQHLLRDIRKVNKLTLAQIQTTPEKELTVVMVEEN